MSYNITTWKIKSIGLTLPLDFDYQVWLRALPRTPRDSGLEWCLDAKKQVIKNHDQTWELELGDFDSHQLSGVTAEDGLEVTDIDLRHDGSGYVYSDVLIPLFAAFKGNLDAIVVWEGGDTINRVTIVDGVVTEKELA